MNRRTKAVTLIEVMIGIILSAILIIGVMNIFSSGMKGSTKGLAHQANMETASILMAQIEYDLLRATYIKSPTVDMKDDGASWKFYYAASGLGYPLTVNYSKGSEGIVRNVIDEKTNKIINNSVFAKGHEVSLNFTHLKFEDGEEKKNYQKHGLWIELTVSAKEKRTAQVETFTLKRLIIIRNQQVKKQELFRADI